MKFISMLVLVGVTVSVAMPLQARTTMSATRIVIAGVGGEGGLEVRNLDSQPALVQSWIDDGRADLPPERIDTPFQVLPPLARIEAQASLPLRIAVVRPAGLPTDRESLYWFNMIEIPRATPDAGDVATTTRAQLQLLVRSRIKLIFRPADLQGDPVRAIGQLRWRWSQDGRSLTVANPTPWVVSLNTVAIGDQAAAGLDDGSVLPQGSRTLDFPRPPRHGQAIEFEWIDDWGAIRKATAVARVD